MHDGIPDTLIFDSSDTQVARISPHHQPLTRVVDIFGNTVRYFWQAEVRGSQDNTFPTSLELHSIRYTENVSTNLASHAKVDFFYDKELYCSSAPENKELPIGASLNHRGFFPWYSGRRALSHVETYSRTSANASFSRVRRVKLNTASKCPKNGGAARQLLSVQLVDPWPADAASAEALQNKISFGYGKQERSFDKVQNFTMVGSPTSNMRNALAWGHRQKWGVDSTLERSLLDFDGDGRLDWIQTDSSQACAFNWHKNNGDGTFAAPLSIVFPSEGMAWKDELKPGQGEGCSLSGRRTLWTNLGGNGLPNGTPGNHVLHRFIDMDGDGRPELVTALQYTSCLILHNEAEGYEAPGITEVFHEEWPEHLSEKGVCAGVSDIGVSGAIDTLCRKIAGDDCGCSVLNQTEVDTVVRERVDCGVFTEGDPYFDSNRTSEDGSVWNSESGSCKSYSVMRNGHYPWKVHYAIETENGIYFDAGQRIWSPIPLDPASMESGLGNNGGRGVTSSNHAVMDITGDGVMDVVVIGVAVSPTTVAGENGRHWNVFAGIADPATGKLQGFEDEPYYWIIPKFGLPSSSGGGIDDSGAPESFTSLTSTVSMLLDMNADGLPDLIRRKPEGSPVDGFEIALNTGRGFCVSKDGEVPGTSLPGESSVARTGYSNVGATLPPLGDNGNNNNWNPNSGEGKNFAKLVDFDGDGLPDYYNAGAGNVDLLPLGCSGDSCTSITMGAGAGFRFGGGAMKHYVPRDIDVGDGSDENYWWQISDYMDLDGDGLDDLATPNTTGRWDLRSEDTAPGKPLRLLNAIDNGQGLVTEIEYHPYNDAIAMSNAATGAGMASHIWVATKITTRSEIDDAYSPAPDSEVNIKYGEPAFTLNHRGRRGFRGFESIQTSRPHSEGATSGFSVSEQRYDYDVDWSGRLSDTVTYVDGFPLADGALVASISSKDWSEFVIVSEDVKSFHSTNSRRYNCLNDDGSFGSEVECVSSSHLSGQQLTLMKAISAEGTGGQYLAWVPYRTESFRSVQAAEGSKRSESDVELISDSTKYFLHNSESRSFVREGGQWVLSDRTTQRLNAAKTYVEYAGQYGTIDGATVLWESKVSRSPEGLVVQSQDPEDLGTTSKVLTGYSGLRVHPSSMTNERGHTVRTSTDFGTGQVTRALGANILPCDFHKYEGAQIYFDKLGRPTSVSRRSCAGDSYHLEKVSGVKYVEYDASTGKPAHVIGTNKLDLELGTESVTTTYVDGAGRTLRTELALGSETAKTIFHYNSAGQLVHHEESSPSTDPANTAEFTSTLYTYDSLGRAVSMRQGSNAAIGVDVRYAYVAGESKKTTTEAVSDDGPAGEKLVYADHFGRLVEVAEKMDDGTFARTIYEYDGNDNVAMITDAAGVITEMVHDMAGRRTKVIRGEREWSYGYNKNGSMVRETSPNSKGERADNPGAGYYTTSTVYDVLDRPTSRVLAINDLSNKQLKIYDAGFVSFEYDDCDSGKGKLCSVESGESLATIYTYDWAGRIVEEQQKISVHENVVDFGDKYSVPDFSMSRSSYFAYNSSGAVTEAWLPDGADQDSSTHLQYEYNEFTGAPEKLSQFMGLDKKGNPALQEIAFVTRNRAQRVVSQTTGCLTRQWDYDYLGRVTDTEVVGVGCTTQNGAILSESMQYFDSSEVRQHDVYRAGLPTHTFHYDYDSQHQLVEADDSNSYRVAFSYLPNGTMESVSGIDGVLLGRDPMVYSYGDGTLLASGTALGADEHAPVTLSGVAKDLHYSYDFSGNVTQRTEITDPTGSPSQDEWSFSYDGVSQQREVQLNNGTGGRELYYYGSGGQRYMAVIFANSTDRFPERIRIWMGGAEIWYRPNATADGMEVDTEYAYLSLGAINVGRIKSDGPVVSTEATFANGLSHVMGSVDWDTGVVNAAYIYGPYGEIVASVGAEQEDHLRRFNGKESDQLSKLSYYGYRYYDKQSLSWTQADPLYLFVPDIGIDEPRRMSLYTFSLNNPVRYLDPDGRNPEADEEEKEEVATEQEGDESGEESVEPTVDVEGSVAAAVNTVAQALAIHAGRVLYTEGGVRASYNRAVDRISGTDAARKAARKAAREAARAGSTALGKAIAENADRLRTGQAARHTGDSAKRTSGSFNRAGKFVRIAGKLFFVGGVALSVTNVATAPAGQRARVVAQESGMWTGALSGGAGGANIGARLGKTVGPVGAIVGAVGGGAIGAVIGGDLGGRLGSKIFDWVH